ncbi:hypothetical protein MtrunA17_Chr4g0037151 [Medicago truncatula]|uniref:Uncharacterized protein n=1 Tax=Medicago truncatula TaxID=3880 RepID=A0A072UL63_MEDTR|nr:hypothetical protein MTR_4g073490 [Medicago truncatula]RHN61483.1 hypothetical protein MtrunA17_Chr4g0037151 [Medicago truncatula]
MDDLIPVNAVNDQIAAPMSIFGSYKRWYSKYLEDFRQTVLRCAVTEIHNDGKTEISTYLKVPLFLAWLSSWGPMNPDSHVGIVWDYENIPLPKNFDVDEFEYAMIMVLKKNELAKSEDGLPKILTFGHFVETKKLRANITSNIKYQRTMRGRNFGDAQIKKAMLACGMAK